MEGQNDYETGGLYSFLVFRVTRGLYQKALRVLNLRICNYEQKYL